MSKSSPVGPDVLDAGDLAYDPLAAGLEGVPGCSQLVDLLRKLPIRHPQVQGVSGQQPLNIASRRSTKD